MNHFETLNSINVGDKTEKKNGLTYLSWAWAWAELKKRYPLSRYAVYENADGWNYHTDGKTAWVKTGVTIITEEEKACIEHIEYLPVMDFRNKSIPLESITSMDVNKAIQRSLTKAVARHGLGLYIYAGEDLPEAESEPEAKGVPVEKAKIPKPAAEPVKVSISVTPEELTQRKKEVAALQKQYNITPEALKAFTEELGCLKLNEQTAQEYTDFLVAVQKRFA